MTITGQPAPGTLFGFKWELVITTNPSTLNGPNEQDVITIIDNGGFQEEELQIQFECTQTVNSVEYGMWFAEISIYNLNDATTREAIISGCGVKLSAGWRDPSAPYGVIFEGMLYQPIWERIEGVNYKLTLRCLVGLVEQVNQFIAGSIAAGSDQRAMLARLVANTMYPVTIDINSNVDQSKFKASSRGEIIFGTPNEYLSNIADEIQANIWIKNLVLVIGNLRQLQDNVPTITYTPDTGLIGTPQQTYDGVNIKVALDPRLIPAMQIHLPSWVTFNILPRSIPGFPNVLDQTGNYGVMSVRHTGDSRGGIWETEAICITYLNKTMSLLNNPQTDPN